MNLLCDYELVVFFFGFDLVIEGFKLDLGF